MVHPDRGDGRNVGRATACMQTQSQGYEIGTVYAEGKEGIRADVVVPDTILYSPNNDESDDESEWRCDGSDDAEVEELFEQSFPDDNLCFRSTSQGCGHYAEQSAGVPSGYSEDLAGRHRRAMRRFIMKIRNMLAFLLVQKIEEAAENE